MIDRVGDLLCEVGATDVMPVYRRREADPVEASPGEWVTTADLAAEARLVPGLLAASPKAVVVAEEGVKADPSLLEALDSADKVWLVDPLDGTGNFASGEGPFRIMVALVVGGVAVASWIHDPVTGSLAVAERGSGAVVDGQKIVSAPRSADLADLRGSVLPRFLSPERAAVVQARRGDFARLDAGSVCAGHDYVAIAQGRLDVVLYERTLPWDHVPGALFLSEAGGVARRPDGTAYEPRTHARRGLLAAASEAVWRTVHEALEL